MTGKLEEPRADIEITDELPVLSEEALLRLEHEEQMATGTTPEDALEASVDTLRQALELAEARWSRLEARLETQNDAISRLQAALGHPNPAPPEETHAGPADQPAEAAQEIPELTDRVIEAAGEGESEPAADRSAAEQALLERIAMLETYIAGRSDRWKEMENALESSRQQIDELERELEQRVSREQNLAERLHIEGSRTRGLRDRLLRVTRRLEDSEHESPARERLDETREMPSAAGGAAGAADPAVSGSWQTGGPALVGLSADAPRRCALDRDITRIGRSAECDILLASHAVSRQHATIRRRNGRFIIEDEGSLNGIFVNSVRVTTQALEPGDWITIGDSQFRFLGGS